MRSDGFMGLEEEVKLHERYLTLLALYYDLILINTGDFANLTNQLMISLVKSLTARKVFKKLAERGIIKFCGWGGNSKKDMITSTLGYSERLKFHLKDNSYHKFLFELFSKYNFVSRSENMPDDDFINYFNKYYDNLNPIKSSSEESLIEITNQSFNKENNLSIINFIDKIKLPDIPNQAASNFFEIYTKSYQKLLDDENNNIYTFCNFRLPDFLGFTKLIGGVEINFVSTLATHPLVFEHFLRSIVGEQLVSRIIKLGPKSFLGAKNGDWFVFKEFYHDNLMSLTNAIEVRKNEINQLSDLKKYKLWQDIFNSNIDLEHTNEYSGLLKEAVNSVAKLFGLGWAANIPVVIREAKKIYTTKSRIHKNDQLNPFLFKLIKHMDTI